MEEETVKAKRIFNSAQEAALFVLNRIREQDYEVGGGIWQDKDGFFSYSDPQGSRKTGTFMAQILFPKSAKLSALYHTHPGEAYNSEYFSADDVRTARKLMVQSFIKQLATGAVRRFDPETSPTQLLRMQRVSKGELLTE